MYRLFVAVALVLGCAHLSQAQCPVGFLGFQDSCYFFSTGAAKLNWYEAQQSCDAIGGRFASIEGLDERNYVADNVKNTCGGSAWVGGNVLSNLWRWFHNREKVTYTDWASGEPNNSDGSELCLEIDSTKSYRWNDEPCTVSNCYVCEAAKIQ